MDDKKKTLNNLKKRNEQSRKNKKKLVEIKNKELNDKASNRSGLDALNETNDIGSKNMKKNSNTQANNTTQNGNKKKKKNEPGCECHIF